MANIQSTFPQLPTPNVTGMANFNTIPIQYDTDNVYALSAALTKVLGRHTVEFGGEMRKFEWDYAQSNSAGTTFNSPSSQGIRVVRPRPAPPEGMALPPGWWLPTYAQAAEPALSKGVQFYSGLYVNDSFRLTPKLTINAGLRWERPGRTQRRMEGSQRCCWIAATRGYCRHRRTVTGGLGLINSPQYPHKNWQPQSLRLFSPGLALLTVQQTSGFSVAASASAICPLRVASALARILIHSTLPPPRSPVAAKPQPSP